MNKTLNKSWLPVLLAGAIWLLVGSACIPSAAQETPPSDLSVAANAPTPAKTTDSTEVDLPEQAGTTTPARTEVATTEPSSTDFPIAEAHSSAEPAIGENSQRGDRCDLISSFVTCLTDILHDQAGIWTAPAHMHRRDAIWLIPVVAATGAAFATDYKVPTVLGNSKTMLKVSGDISQAGTDEALVGGALGMWAIGKIVHNDHVRETGMVSLEALADVGIVGDGLKLVFDRWRPGSGQISGEFWPDNPAKPTIDADEYTLSGSFPSGHAIASWAMMHVLVDETPGHRWWHVGFYGLAAAISISRITAERHFPSDVIVGGTLGYLIGGYVYRQRSQFYVPRAKSVSVMPIYDAATRTYGMSISVVP